MQNQQFSEQELREIRKIKRTNYTVFGIFVALFAIVLIWWGSLHNWNHFSQQKWLEHPEKRAGMTADLFDRYDLVGMSEEEVIHLLGPAHSNQDDRLVYDLGDARTIIDSEWLLIDFKNGAVSKYSMTTD